MFLRGHLKSEEAGLFGSLSRAILSLPESAWRVVHLCPAPCSRVLPPFPFYFLFWPQPPSLPPLTFLCLRVRTSAPHTSLFSVSLPPRHRSLFGVSVPQFLFSLGLR